VAEPQINRFIHCLHPLLSYVVFVVCDIGRFSCTGLMLYVSYDHFCTLPVLFSIAGVRGTVYPVLFSGKTLQLDGTSGNEKSARLQFHALFHHFKYFLFKP